MEMLEDRAVIDACVMANARAADILLRLACEGTHSLYWSQQILGETKRTQLGRLRWEPSIVESYHRRLGQVFPDAVIRGHERWLAQCTNHEGDRHVLACAIEARARYIVTFNEKHFKDAALAQWKVRALTPNDYLWMRYFEDEKRFKKQLSAAADKKGVFLRDILEGLLRDYPSFAEHMLSVIHGIEETQ